MPGRKPKPTALKQVLGNPGHRELNMNEPKPSGDVMKPRFVKGRAAKIWQTYAPQLMKLGVLTSVDAHMFGMWCCIASEFEKDPDRMPSSRISQMRALASSFGMDASSRSRLSVKDAGESQDPTDKYFNDFGGSGNTLRQ